MVAPNLAMAVTAKNLTKPVFDQVVTDAGRVGTSMTVVGNRAATAMSSAGYATGNLAAQLNDIGVMLASGQSPLLLAIQQGTQINQIFAGMSGGQALGALKTAFLSLINPLSLVTIGTIAAGAALFQWAMTAREGAETASEALERHQKVIQEVVAGYSDAERAVNDYFRIASKLPTEISADRIRTEFASIKNEVDQVQMRAAQIGETFVGFGSTAEQELSRISKQFADGEISATEFYLGLQDVRGELTGLETALSGISAAKLISEMEQGAIKTIQFGNAINNLIFQSHALAALGQDETLSSFFANSSAEKAVETLKSLTPELRTQQQIVEDTYQAAMKNPALTDEGRSQLAQAKETALAAIATAEARREAGRASAEAARDAERESGAVGKLIAQLEHEQSLLGLTNEQKAVSNALRQAGAAATDDERARIVALVTAINEQQEAQKQLEDQMKFYKARTVDFVLSLNGALREGKDFWTAFGEAGTKAFDKISDRALNMALDGIFDMIFGALGGGLGVGKGLTGAATYGFTGRGIYGLPGMADGGTVAMAGLSWVGEEGPELLRLPQGAEVIPNGPSLLDMERRANDNGPREINVRVTLSEGLKAEIVGEARAGAGRDTVKLIQATDKAQANRRRNGG